jgi:hypothetical protein
MRYQTLGLAILLFARLNANAADPVVIKSIAILGPITGSQDTAGQVEIDVKGLAAPSLVNLQSSDPRVAAVPQTISARGVTTFVVKTFPVTSPTDVTITAQISTLSKSATLRVLPPKLVVLGCDLPETVAPGKPLNCTAWLDGKAAEDISVSASSSSAFIIVPDHVTIPKGANKGGFQVTAQPIAQSVSGQVSIAYARVTKSQTVTVMPVALEKITTPTSTMHGGLHGVPLKATLTSPAPQSGLKVKVSVQVTSPQGAPMPIKLNDSVIEVQEGRKDGVVNFSTSLVSVPTSVTFTGSTQFAGDNESRQVLFTVLPADLDRVAINPSSFSHVPLGGDQATVTVQLNGDAGGNTWIDIAYSGDTQITGPARIQIPYDHHKASFNVTVSPCSVSATCKVIVTGTYLGKQKQATATVTQ